MAAWHVAASTASDAQAAFDFTKLNAADQRQMQTAFANMDAKGAAYLDQTSSNDAAPVLLGSTSAWPASHGVSLIRLNAIAPMALHHAVHCYTFPTCNLFNQLASICTKFQAVVVKCCLSAAGNYSCAAFTAQQHKCSPCS